MPSVLIASQALRNTPGRHVELLQAVGCRVSYPEKSMVSAADVIANLGQSSAVIAANEPYSDEVLAALPQLRVIARAGVGYDSVDVEAATRRGVAVTITPQANHQAVAEHALALMLAVARSIVPSSVGSKAGRWPRKGIFMPLRGKTLGIVGLGRIGHSVATRAAALGMRLLACELKPDLEFCHKCGIELVNLDTLLAQADVVTLHVPLVAETRDMINANTLGRMKRGAILINTARGGLVNEVDLVEALRAGQLTGAGLDVLVDEPPPADHPLFAFDNVVLTPHVASFDAQAIEDMVVGAAQCIADLFSGRWPEKEIVNPDVRGRWKP